MPIRPLGSQSLLLQLSLLTLEVGELRLRVYVSIPSSSGQSSNIEVRRQKARREKSQSLLLQVSLLTSKIALLDVVLAVSIPSSSGQSSNG